METNYKRLLTMENAGRSPREVLTQPVTALLGVGQAAAAALQRLNIETVFDLAASGTFRIAAAVAGAVQDGQAADSWSGRLDRLPRDAVDAKHAGILLEDAAEEPTEALRAISAKTGQELRAALTVTTIRDLGLWPPYHAAKTILAEAYGFPTENEVEDPETPEDLVPATGRYPTERVQYQVVVLDQVLTSPEAMTPRVSLLDAGPIDITSTDVEGFSAPALGAVLTYTQSWFTAGLTLGQLLHTVALAPGESTRIAMIDWSRRTGARISEAITETERVVADITRTRSLSEVVNAVANESQTGFSAGGGTGASTTTGSGGGGAVDLTETGYPVSLAGGVSRGLGMGGSAAVSYATSSGRRDINAWMTQNITDSTHQNASSTRNRWATVVREVSQEESESVSTRALTNFNHMHALSVEYFEVVQLYRTVVELARAERCLFVPMRPINFRGTDAALRFRRTIAAVGLFSSVRALAQADPDAVLVTASNRFGPWDSGLLNRVGFAGTTIASESSSVEPFAAWNHSVVPTVALTASPPSVIADKFEDVEVVRRSAPAQQFPILAAPSTRVQYEVDLSGFPQPAEFSLRLRKKESERDWAGTVYVELQSFPASGAQGRYLAFSVDVPAGDDVILAEFTPTLGQTALVEHLQDNALYYSQAIWRDLDGATLGHLLDHYTMNIGGTETSLADVLDPIPVGVAGNYLMFRLPSDPGQDRTWRAFLDEKGLVEGSRREDLVPLPSGGVFAEAVLGRFNAAEKIDLTRFWNWQDSPIPITAPEIATIQTGSRAQPEPGEPGQLGAPVVNIQNAPGLPDPQGLTAVLQALANGAMFRDMSGLEGTQQLVRAFLEETMRGATASAAQAGQNMQTAADFASRMSQIRAASQQAGGDQSRRWGGAATPNNSTVEGGRLNYGRELDERQDGAAPGTSGQTSSAERDQYNAGIGGASSAAADESPSDDSPSFELAGANVSESRRWRDLICFRPPSAVLQGLRSRDMEWLRLDNALGRLINLDNYQVQVRRMPVIKGTRLDAQGLAREFRRGLTGRKAIFVDPEASTFEPYDPDDGPRWISDNPVGAVLYIDIPWDDGSVVVSRADPQRWVFTAVKTERSGTHPITGNREFGVTRTDNGEHVLYSRGADRSSSVATAEPLVGRGMTFAGGERLWLSMQQRVAAWVKANQGEASVITPYSERFSWVMVQALVRCPQEA